MELKQKLTEVEGHLGKLDENQFERLDFNWEGIQFHAASDTYEGGGIIQLNAKMGRLYYTIEDKAQRAMAIERVFSTNRGIDGAYQITKNGDVSYESKTATGEILRGKELLSALTVILLEAETHLRALRSHLKEPA